MVIAHSTQPRESLRRLNDSRVRPTQHPAHRPVRTKVPHPNSLFTTTQRTRAPHTRCPITGNSHPRPSTLNRTQRDERRHPSACAAAGGCSRWGRTQELLSPGQRDREDVQSREKGPSCDSRCSEHQPGLSARRRLFQRLTHAARCAGGSRSTAMGRGRRSGRTTGRWAQWAHGPTHASSSIRVAGRPSARRR